MTFFYLLIGIAGLWLASEIAISGALHIAERFKISRVFIGLTILAIGTDVPELFIDVAAATERKIPVTNTPGVLTDATADMAWALLMSAARRVAEGDRLVRTGIGRAGVRCSCLTRTSAARHWAWSAWVGSAERSLAAPPDSI